MPDCIPDIRRENHITAAYKEGNIQPAAGRCRRDITMQGIGMCFVEIKNHRVFLCGIEIFGFVQDPFFHFTGKGFPFVYFGGAPVVVFLLGVNIR